MSLFHDQMKFLQAGDVEVGTKQAEALASDLVLEEYQEFSNEWMYFSELMPGQTNIIKEALDLMYVTAQYLNVTIGADKALECWNELHKNNMSKCQGGKLVKRGDGKILKSDSYKPLDLSLILEGK